ncbi:hypothetical protein HNQ77_003039 [Silvibacterium bohemicum]|uniref:Uncharacterized protein n=1 Tax=Silvibacterium bohemicum TaxID=1577686 RepID=A0A841JUL2_9BACT|nr:hypothetical protein [Silvibacterium bohemicum]MBB6145083.1 hypothetical protein [Silvibacterium bohemicum]
MPRRARRAMVVSLLAIAGVILGISVESAAYGQDNYEIQVYGSDTVAPKTTMLELHSNFTADGSKPLPGSKFAADRLYPTDHAEHETVEITQGINSWSEVGFYIFTSARDGDGWQWVGDHIRPRVRVPDSWHWPVGVSLSTEIGYQRRDFSTDTWTWEIRPIIDKSIGRWYFTVNPALERSFHGQSVSEGVGFSPNAKFSYDFNKYISGGLEYYADYGSLHGFYSLHNQQQQFFPAVDLNVSPNWEINFGVGVGPTASTDHLIVKAIVGRRFDWTHHRAGGSESTQ